MSKYEEIEALHKKLAQARKRIDAAFDEVMVANWSNREPEKWASELVEKFAASLPENDDQLLPPSLSE